jgi:1-acyl-sn-glycerol-3-phosphate acyltransferase
LIERYFTEPYRFIPPYRRDLWCRFAKRFLPGHVARSTRISRYEFRGGELLKQSVADGAGIVLASNHCRWADGVVLGRLGIELNLFFYYMVSYHIFKQSPLTAWWINRLGCYSVWREGTDREAMRATAHVLAAAERPIVIFPEGTWYRQNDRLGPLQEGLSLMFRMAAKQSERPLRIHPIAIKYWNLDDPRPVLRERLGRLEEYIGWQPQSDLEFVPRIEKLGSALLALKEIEYLGQPQSGTLDELLEGLVQTLVAASEKYHLSREFDGHVMDRIRRVRHHLARRLVEKHDDAEALQRVRQDLDTLLLCENLNAQSLGYLRELPGPERLSETVQRIEETVYDAAEEPVGDLGVVVEVCPALDVRSFSEASRSAADPLMRALSGALQGRLDRLVAQGPPPAWDCPPSFAPRPALAGSGNGP